MIGILIYIAVGLTLGVGLAGMVYGLLGVYLKWPTDGVKAKIGVIILATDAGLALLSILLILIDKWF
jgi:hypothetical protein